MSTLPYAALTFCRTLLTGAVVVQQRAGVEGLPAGDVRRRTLAAHRLGSRQRRWPLLGDRRELVGQGVVLGTAGRRRGVAADAGRRLAARDAARSLHPARRRTDAATRQGTEPTSPFIA